MKTIRTFPFSHVFHHYSLPPISLSLSRLFLLVTESILAPSQWNKSCITLLEASPVFLSFFFFVRVATTAPFSSFSRIRPHRPFSALRRQFIDFARFRILPLETSYVYILYAYVCVVHHGIKVRSKKIGVASVQCSAPGRSESPLSSSGKEREKPVCRQH